eukprot:767303-Pyramimonas_sp.AAC.1
MDTSASSMQVELWLRSVELELRRARKSKPIPQHPSPSGSSHVARRHATAGINEPFGLARAPRGAGAGGARMHDRHRVR